MDLRSNCHPEANGRQPLSGEVAWTINIPLESGEILNLHLGKKGRDLLFGMLIADCQDAGEPEPTPGAETAGTTDLRIECEPARRRPESD